MEESDFEFSRQNLAESLRRFPMHRLTLPVGRPNVDLGYLRKAVDFVRHAWDEGGHA